MKEIHGRAFKQARKFARSLKLETRDDWNEFCKSGKLPEDIPADPSNTYKDKGWVGVGDWLGTGRLANQARSFRSFKQARKFARSLKLKSRAEWNEFCKSGDLPQDIPTNPHRTYEDWVSMPDWLGIDRIANRFRNFRPFKQAREYARGLKLKSEIEWREFTKSGKLAWVSGWEPDA